MVIYPSIQFCVTLQTRSLISIIVHQLGGGGGEILNKREMLFIKFWNKWRQENFLLVLSSGRNALKIWASSFFVPPHLIVYVYKSQRRSGPPRMPRGGKRTTYPPPVFVPDAKIYKYTVLISVCLFVFPIITQEPLDQFAKNFGWGTRENHRNVLWDSKLN